jgi:GAF domain-containing protein
MAPGARVLAGSPEEPLAGAGRALGDARALLPQLERALDSMAVDLARAREGERAAGDLGRRLQEAEAARAALQARLRDNETQLGRLMTLYVATYQLHCTLDPREVQSTIVDIVLNLLGAESFVLLLRPNQASPLEITIAHAPDGGLPPSFQGPAYDGGDPLVDATLGEGALRFGPEAGSPALAAVPLRVQDVIVGALVVFRLLAHKPGFLNEDRELFDLIGAHAASALVASRVYAGMARKLRTLEELMSLVKGG